MSQMDLVSFAVLFLSRETFRLVALRLPHPERSWISWACLPIGVCACGGVIVYLSVRGWGAVPHARTCILLFLAASLVELTGEPAYIKL